MFAAPARTIAAAVSNRTRLAPITSNISPAVHAHSPKACSALKPIARPVDEQRPDDRAHAVQPSKSP